MIYNQISLSQVQGTADITINADITIKFLHLKVQGTADITIKFLHLKVQGTVDITIKFLHLKVKVQVK